MDNNKCTKWTKKQREFWEIGQRDGLLFERVVRETLGRNDAEAKIYE